MRRGPCAPFSSRASTFRTFFFLPLQKETRPCTCLPASVWNSERVAGTDAGRGQRQENGMQRFDTMEAAAQWMEENSSLQGQQVLEVDSAGWLVRQTPVMSPTIRTEKLTRIEAQPVGHSCFHCQNEMMMERQHPDRTRGTITFLVGLLLAPVIIGIPLLLWAIDMMRRRRDWWLCSQCGHTQPVTRENAPRGWGKNIFVPTWAIAVFAVLIALLIFSWYAIVTLS